MTQRLYSGRRFHRAVRAFLLGRAAQGVAFFILTLWLVRVLLPADYGAYMALWGIVELLSPLSSLGLLEATRRFLPDLATRGSTSAVRAFVRWTTLARLTILLAWALLIALLWGQIAAWLGFDATQSGDGWVVVILIVTVLGFRYACEMLEGLLEQRWSQLAHALMPIGRLGGLALLVGMDTVSLGSVLWVDAVVSLGCFLLAEYFLARRLGTLSAAGDYSVTPRTVALFTWHMAGANVLQAAASVGALRLIIARLLGLEAAGLFAFVQQLVSIVSRYMPAQLLANIIRPMFVSRRATGDNTIVAHGLGLMWKSNVLIVICGVALLLVAGDTLVSLASGGRFTSAGMALVILFVGLGASSQGQLINMGMQIHDQARALRTQSLLFLLVPLAAWAGASWGLTSALVGIVLAQWLRNIFAMWWMRRHGAGFSLDWHGVGRQALVALLAAVIGLVVELRFDSWVALAAAAVVLGLGTLVARPLNGEEAVLLQRVLKGKARLLQPFVRRECA